MFSAPLRKYRHVVQTNCLQQLPTLRCASPDRYLLIYLELDISKALQVVPISHKDEYYSATRMQILGQFI